MFVNVSFIGTKVEGLSKCNDVIESCAVYNPLSEGFLLLLDVHRPHYGIISHFTKALGNFCDHSELLNNKNVAIAGDFIINS